MLAKYMVFLVALGAVALAGKKDQDYERGRGCPCADFKAYDAMRDDESYSRGKRMSAGDDEFARKERKVYEKKDKKYRQRYSEDDVDGMPEDAVHSSYNFYEGNDGFLSKQEADTRRQRKNKKYIRVDDDDVDEDFEVSPQCQRYVHDVNRLAKCERKQMEKMSSSEARRPNVVADYPDVPVACQKYAEDPSKLVRCIRKTAAIDVEQQVSSYPECSEFANDPYKMQKCERKARKYAAASTGRMLF